ncbi:hypothetical protein PMIN05_004085 [Paraphaeosphaeria minitans]
MQDIRHAFEKGLGASENYRNCYECNGTTNSNINGHHFQQRCSSTFYFKYPPLMDVQLLPHLIRQWTSTERAHEEPLACP